MACAVVYGTDDGFGAIATDGDMAGGAHTDHAPRMSGLEPDTEYRYVLQGSDADGNLYRSEVLSFRTPVPADAAAARRNVATQATVVDVSSEFSDAYVAGNAIDGDLGTEWSSASDGDDAWIIIELGQPTDIAGVGWRTRHMADGSAVVRSYTVTVDDGDTYGPSRSKPTGWSPTWRRAAAGCVSTPSRRVEATRERWRSRSTRRIEADGVSWAGIGPAARRSPCLDRRPGRSTEGEAVYLEGSRPASTGTSATSTVIDDPRAIRPCFVDLCTTMREVDGLVDGVPRSGDERKAPGGLTRPGGRLARERQESVSDRPGISSGYRGEIRGSGT